MMAKMNARLGAQGNARTATSPIMTDGTGVYTGEGSPGFSRTAKSDLFLLAVSNFVGEKTFYESADARDTRFESLVHQVTAEDPRWMQSFIPWLRKEGLMRTASLVAAAEYVKAGGPDGRKVVASAIARADEPSEMLAYWLARHGRKIPQPIKRGVADAARQFYTERNVLKYNSGNAAVKMTDVLQLAHVKPRDDAQSMLFKYLLSERYGDEFGRRTRLACLPMLSVNRNLRTEFTPERAREMLLADPDILQQAGMTWESLSSFGPMDKAAWEAIIPRMGYMALLRNLRNFDEAGVSDEVAAQVAAKLSDPEEVARSRQLPFRFWSAYQNAPSLRWAYALEKGLDLSTQNVPELDGETLLLVDTSLSMTNVTLSERSKITAAQAGALFGAILARKNAKNVRMVGFASGTFEHSVRPGESALKIMESFHARIGEVGHGTDIARALATYRGERRIVLISDLQTSSYYSRNTAGQVSSGSYWGGSTISTTVPKSVPIHAFNIGGYSTTSVSAGNLDANEFEYGGMSDRTFTMLKLIESAKSSAWPWEN